MTSRILFFSLLIIITAVNVNAQKAIYAKPNGGNQAPFGKKIKPPVSNPVDKFIALKTDSKKIDFPYTLFDTVSKRFIVHTPGDKQYIPQDFSKNMNISGGKKKGTSLGVHLTKDINTLSESFPTNYPNNAPYSFAVLNKISYFFAEDGIHGRELWRSDGTDAGTYMVKDITPGIAPTDGGGIITANGLLIFSATTPETGQEVWVSDGTDVGTNLLKDLNNETTGTYPNQFVLVDRFVFFVASIGSSNNQLWKTDGTEAGTTLVKDLTQSNIGYGILELTHAAGLVFFIANTWNSGLQLFRSDGTDAGTYVVKETGYFGYGYEFSAPMQLTEYYGKLFFSVDDGTGRRLWTSDGTNDGTSYAPGYNEIFMRDDYMNVYKNFPFSIINNVLYISGKKNPNTGLGELYKYDGANSDGIVLVKELSYFSMDDVSFIVPVDMTVIDDKLFLKVISNVNGWHDELWSSAGESNNTQLISTFPENQGVYTYNYYNANGTLYFVIHDNIYGNELWRLDGTTNQKSLVRDIYVGISGSFPENLTFCNGKLLFRAFNINFGSELWSSDGTEGGTSLVKDINTTSTNSSNAGSNFFYKGIGETTNGVVFNALTTQFGAELYKSDGTAAGTVLLNDIRPGEDWSYPNNFIFKNNVTYFINDNSVGTSLYKTDGTSAGLERITAYINRELYYVVNYNVTDNGLAFYTLGNRFTGAQELWRSNGTESGTYMLTSNLSYYYNNYVAISDNTVFFIAGDFEYGYELWKSDGTIAGTKMVKDINRGSAGSDPYNLFIYKKDVYFGAWDGGLNYSLWKSDGSEKGTVKLKSITPAYYFSYFNTEPQHVFCVSNSILYFSASDFNSIGGELWKTNGTEAGTTLVKDINPYYSSDANNLTDVKGILYFTADDGVHGNEIWKTNGTSQSTQMVKDITPGYSNFYYYNLCSAGGKLYFLNPGTFPDILWSSDGTVDKTSQVVDKGLSGLSSIENLTGVGDKLFFGAYSYKYGAELYEGNAVGERFGAAVVSASNVSPNPEFDAELYPNPTNNSSLLVIKGNLLNVEVIISDISGRIIWNNGINNTSQINLPVERFAPGAYIVTVTCGLNKKVLKLVRE